MTKEEFFKRVRADYHEGNLTQLWADIEAERQQFIDWDKVPAGCDSVALLPKRYNVYGDEIACYPRPAPKYREMTREEKIEALDSLPYLGVYQSSGMLTDKLVDDLCKAAGVDVRVRV